MGPDIFLVRSSTVAKGRISPQELKRDPLMEQYVTTATWVKGRSQSILRWGTVLAIALAVVAIIWLVLSRRANNAAEAMAEAFRHHNAVVANPIPPNAKGYAYTTQEEKDRKSFEAFEKAAADYPSHHGEIARFYAATHQLNLDPEKALVALQSLSANKSEIGAQARLTLANRYVAIGRYEEALAELKKLKASPFSVPSQVIDIAVAEIHEWQGQTQQAIDLYFSVANDTDWRSTALGVRASNRLSILSPDKFEQLPEPKPTNPMSAFSGPML
jgi:tetratricopeptide (TPR) repeat protein